MSDVSDEELQPGVLIAVKDALLRPLRKPIHYVTSKTAQKAYLTTVLAIVTASFLFITAAIAYIIFYFSYVPDRGFTKPVYLQFGQDHPPYGYASIAGALVSYQPYDVRVILHMPRTPNNKATGNFMVDLRLLAPGSVLDVVTNDESKILAKASRSAILTYQSTAMELVHRGAALPLHLVGLREEAEVLKIAMIESAEFSKGWRNIPDQVRLELRSDEKLQIYSAKIEITARLRGLRYFMYNFRITSFFVLTSVFWMVEISVTALVWLSLSSYLSSGTNKMTVIKNERTSAVKQNPEVKDEDEMSDTPHTFPTLTGQPPLRYSSPRVKEEEPEDLPAEHRIGFAEQADDEDEDVDYVRDDVGGQGFTDSGIGTSMESGAVRSGTARRRRSRVDGE